MNLSKLKISWVPLKSVLAVHLMASTDDQFRAEWVVLARSGGKISRRLSQTAQGTLEQIVSQLPSKYPVVLALDGKGVLYKTGEPDWTNPQQVFRELVPQSDFNDFYLKLYPNATKLWVAISRKSFVQPIIKVFADKTMTIIDLQFGPFALEKIEPLLNHESLEWNLPGRHIIWEDHKISDFSMAQTEGDSVFLLGDEEITSGVLCSFAHAFMALVQFENMGHGFEDIAYQRTQFIYKHRIQKVGIAVLLFYLALLLGNYLLFTQYSDRLNLTLASYQNSLKTINRLETLMAELRQKEELAKKTGYGDRDQLSFVGDQIAASLPDYITLSSLSINPIVDKQRSSETPQFHNERIVVAGELNNGVKLYAWIEKLKALSWIVSLEVMELEQETAEKPALFTIEMVYHLSGNESFEKTSTP
jgi:hypothetical protein